MKKIEIETECGKVSTIYVSQDVTKITVDGDPYTLRFIKQDSKKVFHQPIKFDDIGFMTEVDDSFHEAVERIKVAMRSPNSKDYAGTLIWFQYRTPDQFSSLPTTP